MNRVLLILSVLCAVFVLPVHAAAQESIDDAANAAIRAEATSRSQVMHTMHVLADRFGPRLTGSPNLQAAAEWTARQLTNWGLKNAHLEPWDFGHPGWSNASAQGALLAPVRAPLLIQAAAWTPSTSGTVTASAIQLIPSTSSRESLSVWLESNAARVRGKIVLIGKAAVPEPPARADAPRGEGGRGERRGAARAERRGAARRAAPQRGPQRLAANEADAAINRWLVAGGALVRLYDGGGANGLIREAHNRAFEPDAAIPGAILRNEDFGRIERLLADGDDVTLSFTIVNQWHPQGRTALNVVAEIPGTDRADEIVMLGAHLDSWHLATGATDNAAGAAMMMEAVRVIQAAGLQPRRTIRIGLWSGEEEGLLGSQAYVRQHFGTFETPKPEFAKILTYFNIDSGAGSVRSVMVFGPDDARSVLADAIAPFADLGASGSSAFLSRALGSTDSSSFSHAGISTVDLMQNSTDYGLTHHTNFDTYERVSEAELTKGATVIAAAVWHVANRPGPFPLFTRDTMPPAASDSAGRRGNRP